MAEVEQDLLARGTRTAAPVVSPGLEPEPASGTGAVH